MDPNLLRMAKLDYNIVQSVYTKECSCTGSTISSGASADENLPQLNQELENQHSQNFWKVASISSDDSDSDSEDHEVSLLVASQNMETSVKVTSKDAPTKVSAVTFKKGKDNTSDSESDDDSDELRFVNTLCSYYSYRAYMDFGFPDIFISREVCKIVGDQRYTKRLNDKQITALLKVTCQRPRDRENDILQET